MLTLLLGRAGTGKTETCVRQSLRALREGGPDGRPLVLLAPEQATYQLERAVLDRLADGAAVARLQVLSFRRLARRVLDEVGGTARPRLAEAGRRMLLQAILRERQDQLRTLGASAERPGLAAALARQLSELQAYALTPDRLRAAAGLAEPGAADRLLDVALLWEAYRDRVAERALDAGSELARAAVGLPESSLAAASVWADGFAGFTPSEEAVLAVWLRAGADLSVALCLDGRDWLRDPGAGSDDPHHPFAPTVRTAQRLLRLEPGPRVEVLDGDGPPGRFRAGGDLARLEGALWWPAEVRPPGGAPRPASPCPPEPQVFLREAPDPAAEVRAAADEIDRLCREEGYRRREIAIVLRDLESYHDQVRAALAARGIPVFVDRPRPAARHPVPAGLAAALEVIGGGWSLEGMRRYLHCDLCGLPRERADDLENWALAHGLHGPAWHQRPPLDFPPPRPPRDDAADRRRHAAEGRREQWRRRAAAPVRRLERDLAAGGTGAAAAAACRAWLAAVRAPEAVQRWIASAEADGDREEADWHRQCWGAVDTLLDQLSLALEGRLGVAEVRAALAAGLEDLTVALVPPRLDEVLCGAVHRSRHPELRAAFVLGAADGSFPPPPAELPLVGDAARLALREAGVDLAPTAEERLAHERYLAYVALTRARDRLYLSWPAAPGPSAVVRRVREVLPAAGPWPAVPEPTARRGVHDLVAEVALHLRADEVTPEWEGARLWLAAHPAGGPSLQAALAPTACPALPPELAAPLYGEATTPSRLEAAAACAYRHFAAAGLRLQRREEADVEQTHLGELLHAALAAFIAGLLAGGVDPAELTDAQAQDRSAAALQEAAPHVLARLPHGSARGRWLLQAAARDLDRAVQAVVAHARGAAYRPTAVERTMEWRGVRGRIDRVDEATAGDGRRFVRIVDYKTGSARFDLRLFLHRLDLAPAVYLAAAAADARPGGCYIQPVRDEVKAVDGPGATEPPLGRLQGLAPAAREEADLHGGALSLRFRRDGKPPTNAQVASPARFDVLRRALERRVDQLRREAAAGQIAPNPWRLGSQVACAQCDFLDVCGFDRGAGDRFRPLSRPSMEHTWRQLEEEDGEGDA